MNKLIKNIILMIVMFLVVGCSATYNLNINNDDTIQETFTIKNLSSSEKSFFNSVKSVFTMYNIIEENGGYILYNSYKDIDEYLSSTIASNYFDLKKTFNKFQASTNKQQLFGNYVIVDEDDNIVGYSDTSNFSLKVILNSEKKIINSNQDNIENGNYIWNYNDNNFYKTINFEFKAETKRTKFESDFLKIIGIGIGFLLIVVFFLYKKSKKVNDI